MIGSMWEILVSIITFLGNLLFFNINPLFINTPYPSPKIDPLLATVSSLSLEEKIRQTLVCGFSGNNLNDYASIQSKCGNIIYLKNSLLGLSDTDIIKINGHIHQNDPLSWIMIDQEGGRVNRLKDGSPSPRQMAENNSVAYWGEEHGKLLKKLGFDVNLAPVADITENNSAIKNRSFADDPAVNGQMATVYLQALQDQGIIGVVKHLPGHGRVDYDSHKKLASLKYSWEEIQNFDLVPFIDTIHGGAKIVMIGHIIIPELDSTPSSISRPVLEKLRAALPFSDDLIFITDSLSMKGVGLPVGQAIVEAFLSGEDMVILEDTQETEFFDTLILLYQNGTLDIKRLDQSVYRILKIKSQFGKSMTSPQ